MSVDCRKKRKMQKEIRRRKTFEVDFFSQVGNTVNIKGYARYICAPLACMCFHLKLKSNNSCTVHMFNIVLKNPTSPSYLIGSG